jgi:heavy metal sensor kinase
MLSSIKAKIIIFYLIVLFISLSVLGISLYFGLKKIVYNSIDSSLQSKAEALATLIKEDEEEMDFKFSDEIMWEYSSPKSKSYFQIRRFNGTTIEKSASLKNSELPFKPEKDITFYTIYLNGSPVRLINFPLHNIIVQCAEDMQKEINLLKSYKIHLSLSIFALMVISALGGFLIAKKALNPVKEISATIDRISETNLSERVNIKDIPDELKQLATSFNRTFDRLEKAFNRQKQFIADASHELKTPLSVILTQGEVVLRRQRSAEEYEKAIKTIIATAKMMSQIVQKLLVLARLNTDKIELKFENIDLAEITRESVKLLKPLAEQKSIKINISGDEKPTVFGDKALLLELFTNLIDNAVKYNVSQGEINILFKEEKDFVVTEIRDTGIGIPEKDLDKVFERFYRVDNVYSKEVGGLGLGLSICREIVNLHGGKIEIKSRIGEGTTVSVYLKKDITLD